VRRAQGLLQTNRISADLANQAVAAVVAKCASQGYAETGVLVDADGVQQAVLRGNRAGAHTLDSAFAKAYTAASFKTDTTALVERSKTVPVLANLFKLPHLLLLGGDIVVKAGDEVVGAIGAAGAPGGDLDDACARAGLDNISWMPGPSHTTTPTTPKPLQDRLVQSRSSIRRRTPRCIPELT
jgi:uncharacterized protein GlcG (DUF336 family)